jgi:hypothetical protein
LQQTNFPENAEEANKLDFNIKEFMINGPHDKVPTDELRQATGLSPEDELLRWHQRLGHVSIHRIQRITKLGILPSRLAKCRMPICQSCMFGKLTRRAWRSKVQRSTDNKILEAQAPGVCVSVDQLESPLPGFVGQMKSIYTRKRYKVATIFVDHFSNLSFVHLQGSTSSEDTVKAKHEFERYASTFGVHIRHYHADNGRFADNAWRQDILTQGQRLTYSGVGAHHQNGRAEKRIRDLQDMARTSLVHANRRWPDAIDARLWPYALRHSNDALITTPFKDQTHSPIELFSGVHVSPAFVHKHPFGCPAYVLDADNQSGQKLSLIHI